MAVTMARGRGGINAVTRGCRPDVKARTFYRFAIYADFYARQLMEMYGPTYGLTFSDWRLMAVLGVRAPMSATEAGKLTSLKPDQVTRVVDSLLEKGLVSRRADREDRRRVLLSLSAKGVRTFKAIDKVRYAVECDMLSTLGKAELETLGTVLAKIGAQIEAMSGRNGGTLPILFDASVVGTERPRQAVAARGGS